MRFSQPWFGEEEMGRIRSALSGHVAGDGPFCRVVERRLEALLGCERVLLTTSCTHALELALLALGVGRDREVICPSFTFVSTANAILRVGARPVFADIEETSLGLDPADVERLLTRSTAALLPVHYAGQAGEMDALSALARKHGLSLIEDAAHGLGGTYHGRPLGTLADAGCFSFHETKNLTCGEGGALALQDSEVARRAEIIREKGTNRSAFLRGEVGRYTWIAEGSSYVLSDLLAAILDAQLDRLPEIRDRRARIARRYRAGLAGWSRDHGVRLPPERPDCESAQHIFFLLFPDGESRDRALASLRASGVPASFHYVPLHSSPHGEALAGGAARPLPVTEKIARSLLRLPLHPLLEDAEVDRVIEAVQRCLV
jgi:dTDP-4-amino-4,6-dideoxygalactose transaminase